MDLAPEKTESDRNKFDTFSVKASGDIKKGTAFYCLIFQAVLYLLMRELDYQDIRDRLCKGPT
jgi:hypothetical protein